MTSNFMLSDVVGVSAALFLFPLFVVIPGYVSGWLLNAFGFRERSLLARLAISIPVSIGISPILTYTLWHWLPIAGWILYGAMWASFAGLFVHERWVCLSRPVVSKRSAAVLGIAAGWVTLGTLCLIDLQIRNRLYFSMVAYDYTTRTAITASITRSGVPPHNPFFFPGQPVTLRYHYFWFILCSLVEQISGGLVSSRQSMIAGTVWSGIGLMALVPLYLRLFQPKGPINLNRRMLFGIALLGVTGLDIIPTALLDMLTRHLIPSIEWWNVPVIAWVGAVIWVPHHVGGLIACLTGFLLLWERQGVRGGVLTGVAAGMMFASAVGLSVYITFVFAVFLALWTAISIVQKHYRYAGMILAAGVVTAAMSLPYIIELLGVHPAQGASGGGPFLQFTVRSFRIAEALLNSSQPTQKWRIPIANAALLPLNYILEFGFFFFVGWEKWRKMRIANGMFANPELCLLTMVATSILVSTFLRSSVNATNDLAMRGPFFAQFALLLWGAELLDEGLLASLGKSAIRPPAKAGRNRSRRNFVLALLVLGVIGSFYEICMVRFFPIIEDATASPKVKWLSPDRNLGNRTHALREVYDELKKKLPVNAIVQQNPQTDAGDLFYGLYADRQTAAETWGCGVVFGGDAASCSKIIGPIQDLFEGRQVASPAEVARACHDIWIDALIVKDTDPVWRDKNSWAWKKKPFFANTYARAYLCGRSADLGLQ